MEVTTRFAELFIISSILWRQSCGILSLIITIPGQIDRLPKKFKAEYWSIEITDLKQKKFVTNLPLLTSQK